MDHIDYLNHTTRNGLAVIEALLRRIGKDNDHLTLEEMTSRLVRILVSIEIYKGTINEKI